MNYTSYNFITLQPKGATVIWMNFNLKKFFLALMIILLPLLSINLQGPNESPWFLRPFSAAGGFLQDSFLSFTANVRDSTTRYIDLIKIKTLNRELTSENQHLKAMLLQMQEIKSENRRLNELLVFQQQDDMELMSAQITSLDLFGEHFSVRINRGTDDGVSKGMAVISAQGSVGYILNAHKKSAIVLLLTDRYSVIDAIVQSSRARGIVEGLSADTCILKYLQRTDDIKVGDLVVTSGLDNIFPKGFPIGKVKKIVRKKSDVSQYVEIQPIVDVSKLEEVFIVKKVIPEPTESIADVR